MKKQFIITLLLSAIVLTGCGEKSQIEKAQEKIVEIGEQFLEYELTADDAKARLDSVIVPAGDGIGFSALDTSKDFLSYLILKSKNGRSTFEEIEEQITKIKESNYEYLNEITQE
jgi:hypothetical protein